MSIKKKIGNIPLNQASPQHLIAVIVKKIMNIDKSDSDSCLSVSNKNNTDNLIIIIKSFDIIKKNMSDLIEKIAVRPNSGSYKVLDINKKHISISGWFSNKKNKNDIQDCPNLSNASFKELLDRLILLFNEIIVDMTQNIICKFDRSASNEIIKNYDIIININNMADNILKQTDKNITCKKKLSYVEIMEKCESNKSDSNNQNSNVSINDQNNKKMENNIKITKDFECNKTKICYAKIMEKYKNKHSTHYPISNTVEKTNRIISLPNSSVKKLSQNSEYIDITFEKPTNAIEFNNTNVNKNIIVTDDELVQITMLTLINGKIVREPILIKKSHLLTIKSHGNIICENDFSKN